MTTTHTTVLRRNMGDRVTLEQYPNGDCFILEDYIRTGNAIKLSPLEAQHLWYELNRTYGKVAVREM